MSVRFFGLSGVALTMLMGCAAEVPDSGAPDTGAGVGFGSYEQYQQQREAQLAGQTTVPSAPPVSTETLGGGDVAAEAQAALDATRSHSGQAPLQASPSNPAPAVTNVAGISRENDFEAVGNRRTIQDDAARREALKSQYQQAEVKALPTRRGASGPNLVEYALSTKNARGQGIYRRVGVNLQAKYTRNCAKYPSPDLAQTEFLQKGGPKRDRLGLDPDGDGFACSWDPAPFRAARRAAAPLPATPVTSTE